MRLASPAIALAVCIFGLSNGARAQDAPAPTTASADAGAPVDSLLSKLSEAIAAKDDARVVALEDALVARGKDAADAVAKARAASTVAEEQVSLEYVQRRIDGKGRWDSIVGEARDAKDPKVVARLLALLVRCASRPADLKGMALSLSDEGNGPVRRGVIAAIRLVPPAALESLKAGKDVDSRMAVVVSIEMGKSPTAAAEFLSFAGHDADAKVRAVALRGASHTGGRDLAPFFLTILRDPTESDNARTEAVLFFTHVGVADDVAALKVCLDDPHNAIVHDRLVRGIDQIRARAQPK